MLQDLMNAIARMEGFFNTGNTVAKRNNNPGNLMYAGQRGAIGKDSSGFAIFGSIEDGWAALKRQIELDAGRGHTKQFTEGVARHDAVRKQVDRCEVVREIPHPPVAPILHDSRKAHPCEMVAVNRGRKVPGRRANSAVPPRPAGNWCIAARRAAP